MPKGYISKLLLIMKLTCVIILMALMQVSAATFGQNLTLRENNVSISKILFEIRKQTGYDVLVKSDRLNTSKKIDASFDNVPIKVVLDKLIEGTELEYVFNKKVITIKVQEQPKPERSVNERFQDIDVTGKVVDENGQPIAGATIKIKGATTSTSSDVNGSFFLKNISEGTVLQISYLGYQLKEVKASKDLGNIKMDIQIGKLEEVTVNAGYYTVRDSERTGSIARITSKDIETQPINNVIGIMQGRMAGVSITQTTGTPGGGFDIKIRGQNSIRTDGNSPLYIIDGVPYSSDPIGAPTTTTGFPTLASPINSISPDIIESIEILKDADATAIYGSRGANGVVLISTKKGKPGKTTVGINASSGIGRATRFIELMSTQEYLAMRKQAFINDGLNQYQESDYDINGTWDQNRYTDWQKELLGGSASMHDLQGNITGGTSNSQFIISGNYSTESTVLPGDNLYKKGGFQASFNHQSVDQKFKIALSLNYSMQDNNQPSFDFTVDARSLSPNAPRLYSSDGSLNWENNTWQNPLANLNGEFESKTKDWRANTVISYEFLPGLILKNSIGLTDLGTIETRVDPSTIANPAFNPSSSNSAIFYNHTDRSSWIIEPQINWSTKLGGGKIDVLVGSSFQSQQTNKLYQLGMGFSSNSLIYNLAAANNVIISLNDLSQYRYQALFGRLNYNYDRRYIVNLTARRDGSSRFGPGNQFANFGAVGAAWIFTNEPFFKDNKWWSFGKIRTSYGITGNDQIGDYQFYDTYRTSGVFYNNKIGLQPTRLYNADFAWETNKKLEIALELGFLQNRINFTSSWYKNSSSNQLVGIPFPGTSGFSSLQANLDATVQNTGVEFTVNSENVRTSNFRWNTNFNLSFSRNRLIRFPGLTGSSYSQQYRIGKPLNIQLLYQFKGVNPETGIFEFVDVNNDGRITSAEDRQTIADLTPKYFGGIQNQLTWKSWSLDFLFQFVKQKNSAYPTGTNGGMYNQPKRIVDSWQKKGDIKEYQIFTTGINSNAVIAGDLYGRSDATIVDASYIRLKNISFSYQLPSIIPGTQCKVSLLGQNLLTFTKYKDGDPEFVSYGFLPPLKVITAGFQLTF